MPGLIIGLSGLRGVGKTRVADILVERHGFERIHPFSGGKAAAVAYFKHIGIDEEEAWQMVNGDLKDKPHPLLPENRAPRYFLERFGRFMGEGMGPDWTIGQEIRRTLKRNPDASIIAESIVYEVDVIRGMGGVIVEVAREGSSIVGIETDKKTALIRPDLRFENNGNSLAALGDDVDRLLERVIDHLELGHEPEPC